MSAAGKLRNPKLYALLRKLYGPVTVHKQGEPAVVRVVMDPVKGRKKVADGAQWGENYAVNCPACGDKRGRLAFSHAAFERVDGVMLRFWRCYNENCTATTSVLDRIFAARKMERPGSRDSSLPTVEIMESDSESSAPVEVELPKAAVRVVDLPVGHLAIEHLRSRGVSRREATTANLLWLEYPEHPIPPYNRMIIPVYSRGADGDELVCRGFQARFLADDGRTDARKEFGEIKYYTDPQTKVSQLLYNHVNALGSPVVSVGEGAFDVLGGIGTEAGVAGFTKKLSHRQKILLWTGWGMRGAALIMSFDGDAYVVEDTLEGNKRAQKESQVRSLLAFEEDQRAKWKDFFSVRFRFGIDAGKTPRAVYWQEVFRLMDEAGKSHLIDATSERVHHGYSPGKGKNEQFFA